jgi:hypothetical protein
VRTLLVSAVLAAMTRSAHAQQQEQKLLDRLLKPDMSLESNLQQKQFTTGGATLDKKARTNRGNTSRGCKVNSPSHVDSRVSNRSVRASGATFLR